MSKEERNPHISVIVPVYNGEATVVACLTSVAAAIKTAPECAVQVICIDDGSQDGTWELLSQCSARWQWLNCLHQSNAGVSVARNRGLDCATGDYVTFVDVDDTVNPNTFSVLLHFMDEKYDCILFAMNLVWPDGSTSHPKGIPATPMEGNQAAFFSAILNPTSPYKGYAFGKLVRRHVLEDSNCPKLRFDSAIRILEDEWFWLHAALRCKNVIMLNEVLYNYLKNPSGALAGCGTEDSFEELDLRRRACFFVREVSPNNAHDADLDYLVKCAALVRLFYVKGDSYSLARLRTYWNEALAFVRNGGGYAELGFSRCLQLTLCRVTMLLRLPLGLVKPFLCALSRDRWFLMRTTGGSL